jgi:hypothetical protein
MRLGTLGAGVVVVQAEIIDAAVVRAYLTTHTANRTAVLVLFAPI